MIKLNLQFFGGRGGSSGKANANNTLLSKIDNITSNPIPRIENNIKDKALKWWSRQSWDKKSSAPVQDVDVSSVRSWQDYIRPETLKAIVNNESSYKSSTDLPLGLRIGHNILIMDGNHRVAVDYIKNNKYTKMRVLDFTGRL